MGCDAVLQFLDGIPRRTKLADPMAYPDDLLELARNLLESVATGVGPSLNQAALRRAVSTAYSAIFS